MKRFLLSVLPFTVIAGLLVLLFWQVILQGYVVIDGDNFHLNMPMKYLLVDAVNNHYFPFWNPYVLGGIPYAADLNLGTFNPLNLLYFFFSVQRALTLQIIFELFLIGSFMYLFLKQLVSKASALFGAIVFVFSGTVFVFTSNDAILHTIVYVPLLFYFIQKYFSTKQKKYVVFLVFSQILQIISGHPQITYYTIVFIALFILLQSSVPLRKRLILILTYGLFSLLLAAFQLLPFLQYVWLSNRPDNSFVYATSGSYGISQLLTTFFPTFFGTKLLGNWWGSQVMLVGFVGPTAIVLFFIGLVQSSFKQKAYVVCALFLSFILSLGKWGGMYFLFYYLFPGWRLFRSPGDLFILTTFFACICIASGLDFVMQKIKSTDLGKKIAGVVCIPTAVSWLLTFNTISWQKVLLFLSFHHMPYVSKILFYSPSKIQSMIHGILENLFFLFILLLLTGLCWWLFSTHKRVLYTTFFIITAFSLLLVDRTYLQLAPVFFYQVQQSSQLRALQNPQYRVYAKPVVLSQDRRYLPGPSFFYTEGRANLAEITDNHAIQYKILSITGYTSLVPTNYAKFIGGNNITGIDTHALTQDKLNQLSVKYFLTLDAKGNLQVMQNPDALPRFRLNNPSGNSVSILSINPNVIKTSVTSKTDNTLIIGNTYYPGWVATVNGKKVGIKKYHDVFQQIQIPEGKNAIILSYDPIIWEIGIAISLVSLVGFFVFIKKYDSFF